MSQSPSQFDVSSVNDVNNNSPIQDYVNPDDQTQPTFYLDKVDIHRTV